MSFITTINPAAASKLSLVPAGGSGEDTSIKELPELLKRWMTLQDEMTSLNAEVKQRRAQSKALKDVILRIMETNKVAALNVKKGTLMHKVRESAEPLTEAYLLKHCKEFFGGDEDRAKALVSYLDTHRATTIRHDLRLATAKGGDDGGSTRS